MLFVGGKYRTLYDFVYSWNENFEKGKYHWNFVTIWN